MNGNTHNKKVVKKCFKEFVNILDCKSDYYIFNYYVNEQKKEQNKELDETNKKDDSSNVIDTCHKKSESINSMTDNPASIFVAKNADHVPLPQPRDNPDSIYRAGGGSDSTGDATDARDNDKIDIINIDIDDKNTCYVKNCKNCKNRISYKMNKVNIDAEINSIGDLINLCNDYKLAENVDYNIDMKSLHKINDDLVELNNMIGMKTLKENIVDQLLFYLQNLHINKDITNGNKRANVETGDFLHTVIYGSPGTGKTEVAKIIGRIYANLGVIKSKPALLSDKKKLAPSAPSSRSRFKKVTRSDLIAGYLGQTALKTKDVIKDSLGGVLFIDEAYALGNTEKRDSFAKECIDTLCEALSDNKDSLMVIIAGYEKELNECFFSYNEGLNSRFIWRFKVDDYVAEDLRNIFVKKARDFGWSVDEELKVEWFEKNMKYFKYYGRDMETLFTKTKIAHSRRVFCKPDEMKKKIIMKDLENGFELFIKNEEVKNRVNDGDLKVLQNMYL